MEGGEMCEAERELNNTKAHENKVNTEPLKQRVTHLCIIDHCKKEFFKTNVTLLYQTDFLKLQSADTTDALTAIFDVQNSSVLDE